MSRTSAEDIRTQAVSPESILGGAGAAAARGAPEPERAGAGAAAGAAAGGGAGAGVCARTWLATPSASRLIKRTTAIKRVGILTAKPPWSRERALGRPSG